MRRQQLRRMLAVFLSSGGLVACAGEASRSDPPAASTEPPRTTNVATTIVDGYQLVGPLFTAPRCGLPDSSCDPGDALIQGTLVHEDGCLFVDSGDLRLALLWPDGTTWQEEPEAVVGEWQTYLVGDEIEIGGGGQNVANLAYFYPSFDPPSELLDCASTPDAEGFWQTG